MHTQLGSVESDVVYHMTAEEKFGMHAIVLASTVRFVKDWEEGFTCIAATITRELSQNICTFCSYYTKSHNWGNAIGSS